MVLMQADNVLTSAHGGKHTWAGFRDFVQPEPRNKNHETQFPLYLWSDQTCEFMIILKVCHAIIFFQNWLQNLILKLHLFSKGNRFIL